VDALDTEQRVRARAPVAIGTRHRVIHARVSFGIGLLGRYQFKEALTSFSRTTPQQHRRAPRCRRQPALTMLICEGTHWVGRSPVHRRAFFQQSSAPNGSYYRGFSQRYLSERCTGTTEAGQAGSGLRSSPLASQIRSINETGWPLSRALQECESQRYLALFRHR
jgi:hypothetical protein